MVQIFLRGIRDRTCVVNIGQGVPVKELKEKIQERHGIPHDHLSLVYRGRELQNNRCISFYGVETNSTLHAVLKGLGGKGGFGALLRGQGRDGKVTTNFDAMRDLSGRRLRHSTIDQKLKEWKASASERELEKVAMEHIKETARQQRREESNKVDTEAIQGAHQKVLDDASQAVREALSGQASSRQVDAAAKRSRSEEAPSNASTSSNDSDSKHAGSLHHEPAKKKPKMLAMLEDISSSSDEDDSDDDVHTASAPSRANASAVDSV